MLPLCQLQIRRLQCSVRLVGAAPLHQHIQLNGSVAIEHPAALQMRAAWSGISASHWQTAQRAGAGGSSRPNSTIYTTQSNSITGFTPCSAIEAASFGELTTNATRCNSAL
jgi:hypothetical protein